MKSNNSTLSLSRINKQIDRLSITGLIVLLALFGGVQFYWLPAVPAFFLGTGAASIATAIWLVWCGRYPPLLGPALIILAAMAISSLANLDIWSTSTNRLSLATVAIAVMVLAHDVDHKTIFDGLHRAAMIWPAVYFISAQVGWSDNANILGFWEVPFITILVCRQNWLFVLLHLAVFPFGCRGAILALAVALYTLTARHHPLFSFRYPIVILVGIIGLIGLAAWQPNGTMIRLIFWQNTIQATLTNPIFGVGPGGLHARNLIAGGHPHAHNFILSGLAETGLIGLLAGSLIIWWIYVSRFTFYVSRFTLAVLAGILAHSLVDQPLWWPGPLLLAAIVAGSIKKRDKKCNTFGKETC